MIVSLDIINTVLVRYGIEPFSSLEEARECAAANMPVMTEAQKLESLRRLWQKIAEREAAKDKQTEYQTIPQMALV